MIEGSLRNVPLTDVFQVIATSQKSGTLNLSRGKSRARVNFLQGRIQYAHLVPGINLGEILVRLDVLDPSEMLTLLLAQRRENPGLPLARAALEAGYINEQALRSGLERQIHEVLSELLGWRSGNFSFGEDEDYALELPFAHSLDAMMLLMQVTQRLAEYEEGAIEPTAVYRKALDPTEVEMPANGWEVLAAVDGRRNAASVAADSPLPERHAYLVLYSLQHLGVIERSPFQVEVPLVLLLSSSNAQGRLLRLLLQRCRVLPHLESEPRKAMTFLADRHPRAIVVDDQDGSAWQFVREVRRMPGKSHLPAVVLTAGNEAGLLAKMRRPRALTLSKPFEELDFQRLVGRMVGAPVA